MSQTLQPRNFSPQEMFIRMAQNHAPECAFTRHPGPFEKWKSETLPRVLATLGESPAPVDPNPELIAEWEDRDVVKRRYWIDVGPHISAPLQVNLPKQHDAGKQPALLCWHGHGEFGKDAVMGNAGSREVKENIALHNYDYGQQMAQQRFVTYAIDWMGCGERNDRRKPHFLSNGDGRDWCNLYYLHATMFGMTSLSIHLAHAKAATDFVCTLPEVDGESLGVMGLSGGGTMTVWTALADPRFKAAEIICYSDLWALFGIRDINYCGMQVAPGLYKLVDLPDLQGLIAPRPLLVDIGIYDSCFRIDGALACYRQVEEIYAAAGAAEQLHLDLFPGEHAWGGNKSKTFFNQSLR